jgi:hypothetical protein
VLKSIDDQDRITMDLPRIKQDKLTASLKRAAQGRRGDGRGLTSTA